MQIAVFGLGYVGCISAASLASQGHQVRGVDTNSTKVELINLGKSPIVENQIDELIASAVEHGRLAATTDANEAVRHSDLSLICVGTPSERNGSLDLSYVQAVCKDLGRALANHDAYHVVVIRSTMLPGSVERTVIATLEQSSGKKSGVDFGVCINPEFLRGYGSPRLLQPTINANWPMTNARPTSSPLFMPHWMPRFSL